jgi:ferrous iron transport protein A
MDHTTSDIQLAALDQLGVGETGTVRAVAPTAEFAAGAGLDLTRRLMEIGFIPGERLRVLHRGFPGGEPIAVKIGHSTFALRRFEAALISVARHETRG